MGGLLRPGEDNGVGLYFLKGPRNPSSLGLTKSSSTLSPLLSSSPGAGVRITTSSSFADSSSRVATTHGGGVSWLRSGGGGGRWYGVARGRPRAAPTRWRVWMLGCGGGEAANRTVRAVSLERSVGGGGDVGPGDGDLIRTVRDSDGCWFFMKAQMGGSSSPSEAEEMSSYSGR